MKQEVKEEAEQRAQMEKNEVWDKNHNELIKYVITF
jgi:hypothetical protein